MPAQSKAQQRFMGMVHAVQKGDMEAPSKEVEKAADSMTKKDAKDYASTSHKGLPNKKENMNTTITKSRLKELVKEVMVEENEYQAFFAKALEKVGKSIPSMSDAEKKAFFDKVDTAWNGKGEKNESTPAYYRTTNPKDEQPIIAKIFKLVVAANAGRLTGDEFLDRFEPLQKQLKALKKKNEDLVGGEKYKVEAISTELPSATIPAAIKMKLSQAIDKIKDARLNPMQKLQLVAQVVDSLGVDKSQLGTIANKIRSKMESKK
jgi:translation elongation factor EF-G